MVVKARAGARGWVRKRGEPLFLPGRPRRHKDAGLHLG